MITTITMRKQTPEIKGNWLYKDENGQRLFREVVYLPDNAPLWGECTNDEKEQWEREHPEPEPAEVVE